MFAICGNGRSTATKYMTADEYNNTTTIDNHDEIFIIYEQPCSNGLSIYEPDDYIYPDHEYYLPEDIPKKVSFKSNIKSNSFFHRKTINSISGYRDRNK